MNYKETDNNMEVKHMDDIRAMNMNQEQQTNLQNKINQKANEFQKEESEMNAINVNMLNPVASTDIVYVKNEAVKKGSNGQSSGDFSVVHDNAAVLEVPDDEQAATISKDTEYMDKVRKLGVFSPVRGMANIKGLLGDKIYARIYENAEGKRFVSYCEKYEDGTFSHIMEVAQSDLRIALKCQFSDDDATVAIIKNKVRKFVAKAYEDYEGKFKGTSEDMLECKDVLSALMVAMPYLPVYSEATEGEDKEQLYWEIIQHAKSTQTGMMDRHKAYYALEDQDIAYIAQEMGMKKRTLLQKMKQYGFLYLTPSSRGFQTNARFKRENGESFTEWAYCLYKLEYFAGVKEVEKPLTTF